jgi:hypothetical protein
MLKILTRHEKPSPQVRVSFNINSPLRPKQEVLFVNVPKNHSTDRKRLYHGGIKIRHRGRKPHK